MKLKILILALLAAIAGYIGLCIGFYLVEGIWHWHIVGGFALVIIGAIVAIVGTGLFIHHIVDE